MPVSKAPTAKPMEGPPPTIAAETAELLAYTAGIDSTIHAITAEAVSPDANPAASGQYKVPQDSRAG